MKHLIIGACILFSGVAFNSFNQPQKKGFGKELFEKNCNSCHGLFESYTAEPFPFVRDKRGKQWAYEVVLNPYKLMKKDSVAQRVLSNRNSVMTKFEGILTKAEIDMIYDYVDSSYSLKKKK